MSLNKEILKHTSIYSFATIVGKLIGFLFLPFYASMFKTTGYGVIGMVEASVDLLAILFTYTIQQALSRFYFDKSVSTPKHVVSTSLSLAGGLFLVVAPLIFALGNPLSLVLTGETSHYWVCTLLLCGFFIDMAGNIGGTYLLITQRSILYSTLSLIKLFTAIILNIVFIIVLRYGILGVALSSIICSILNSTILVSIAMKNCGLHFDISIAKKMLRYSMPLVPGNLVSYFARQAERLIIRYNNGLSLVGVLEMGYKWAPLLNLLFVFPFNQYWNPKRLSIAENEDDARAIIGNTFTKFAMVLFFIALILSVNVRSIIQILSPPEFWGCANIASIEILTTTFAAMYTQLNFGFYFNKKTGLYSLIQSITAVIKIGLSFFFIKNWGINGAAFSACVMSFIMLIVATTISQRLYKLEINYGKLIMTFTICIGLYFAAILPEFHLPVVQLPTLSLLNISPGNKYLFKIMDIIVNRQQYLFRMGINTLIALLYIPILFIAIPETRVLLRKLLKNKLQLKTGF